MIRRFDAWPERGQHYRRRPGVYALLLQGDEVLLTHQAAPAPEFQLPGGGIDPGEQVIPALHREVFEETGWTMRVRRRLGAFRRFTYMPEYDLWAEKVCTVFLCAPCRRIGPPAEPGHTAVWAPVATATEILANAGDRHFLPDILRAGR